MIDEPCSGFSGWTTIVVTFMRLLVVTLCCFVAAPIVRDDPAEEAAIEAIKERGGMVEQNGKVVIFGHADDETPNLRS